METHLKLRPILATAAILMLLAGPSVLDSCGPLPDGPPPGFGVIGLDQWMHGVVKNCSDAIGRIMAYMPGTS